MAKRMHPVWIQGKCDVAADPHCAKRPYARAVQSAIWTRSGRVADALGLAQRTVESWGNPADPQHGPLYQLDVLMRTALDAGADEADALAPLRFLMDKYRAAASEELHAASPAGTLADAIREGGEAACVAAEALADGEINEAEYARLDREAFEAEQKYARLREVYRLWLERSKTRKKLAAVGR